MAFDPVANGATPVAAPSVPSTTANFDPVANGATPVQPKSTGFDPVAEGATPVGSQNSADIGRAMISAAKDAWNSGNQQTANYAQIGKNVEDSYMSAINDAGNKVAQVYEDFGNSSTSKFTGDLGEAGLSVVNSLISPITSVFKGAESVPVIGFAAKGINALFAAIGAGTGQAGVNALQSLPISEQTKNNLEPVVQDASSLAGQIIAGKAGADSVGVLHDHVQTILGKIKEGGATTPTTAPTDPTIGNHIAQSITKSSPTEMGFKPEQAAPKTAIEPSLGSQGFEGKFQQNRGLGGEPTFNEPIKPATPTTVARETPPVEAKTAPETTEQPKTIVGKTVPVRTAESAASVGQMADIYHISAEHGYEDLPDSEKAKYSPTTVKEQVQKVGDIMKNNIDDARAMIRGNKPVPNGVSPQVLFNAMEKYGITNRDGEIMTELSKSPIASKLSTSGQEMGLHGHTDNPHSPVAAIREITQARESAYLKKSGQEIPKAKSDIIKNEGTNLDKELKSARSPRPTWEEFVKELSCQI